MKQKTSVCRKTTSPRWESALSWDDISLSDLSERCLELTVWDHDRIGHNDILGGVRFNLGTGKYHRQSVTSSKFCNFTNQLTNVHCALSNIIYQLQDIIWVGEQTGWMPREKKSPFGSRCLTDQTFGSKARFTYVQQKKQSRINQVILLKGHSHLLRHQNPIIPSNE